MTNLGALYADGQGVGQDYGKARSWYERAAAKGDSLAVFNLALLYDQGLGVARNPRTAARRLLASARAGETTARTDLDGDMLNWSEDTVKAAQELLTASGDYTGPIDGNWGSGSRAAARAYYTRRS
jgi:TPR repeat protein